MKPPPRRRQIPIPYPHRDPSSTIANKRKQSLPSSKTTKRSKKIEPPSPSIPWLGQMPNDPLIEILSRLPYKSRTGFRCVSNSCNSMVTHVNTHVTSKKMLGFHIPSAVPIKGYYQTLSDSPAEEFDSRLRSLPFFKTFQMIHSCNGLLLFGRTRKDSEAIYYVWNPTTMEYVELPRVPTRVWSEKSCFLAYDPDVSPHYKVVRFTLNKAKEKLIVEVYSSMTGTWDRSRYDCGERTASLVEYCTSVFHKGALYLHRNKAYLFKFDVEKRSFVVLKLPEIPDMDRRYYSRPDYLGVSRGRLYYLVSFYDKCELQIYMLDELDEEKWQLVQALCTTGVLPNREYHPIALHPNADVIYLRIAPGKIVQYNRRNAEIEELRVLSDTQDYQVAWRMIAVVTPCLQSINPPGGKLIDPFIREKMEKTGGIGETGGIDEGESSMKEPPRGEERAPNVVEEKKLKACKKNAPEARKKQQQEARMKKTQGATKEKITVSRPEKTKATTLVSPLRRSPRNHPATKV